MKSERIKTLARLLREGDRFTYPGSFGGYTVVTAPKPDESIPGRVVLKAKKHPFEFVRVIDIRLRAEECCEVWRA